MRRRSIRALRPASAMAAAVALGAAGIALAPAASAGGITFEPGARTASGAIKFQSIKFGADQRIKFGSGAGAIKFQSIKFDSGERIKFGPDGGIKF